MGLTPFQTERIKAIMTTHMAVDPATLRGESTLESIGIESLDFIEILMVIEDEFAISVPDGDAQTIKTLQQLLDSVAKQVGAAV